MSHDTMLTETEAGPPGNGGDGEAWAWATEHGAPEWASTGQLVAWLARGELPPHTLVWKPGWGEWLPAMQVAEFAAAFPRVTAGSRRMARATPDAAVTPPPVPVAHYPRLRLLAKDVLSESPADPAMAGAQGLVPAQVGRRTLRDRDRVQQDLVTSQVPAAAMLEAALAMQRQGTPVAPSRAERWGQLDLGNFGETLPPASAPPPRTLSPHALELAVPPRPHPEPAEGARRPARNYGRWLLLGALVGGALGLLSVRGASPEAADPMAFGTLRPALPPAPEAPPPPALDTASRALPVAAQVPSVAPPAAKKAPGIVERKRPGEPAVLQALRITKNDGFDRVVFEFRERIPGYRLEYIDKPVRDCGTGDARRIEGDGRLEVRFSPASAHTESGEPTLRGREFKPALSIIREVERTCDFEGVVTWVVGTASPHHYRAFELSAPPRLVVDIDQ